jgi:hypothetical protein
MKCAYIRPFVVWPLIAAKYKSGYTHNIKMKMRSFSPVLDIVYNAAMGVVII